MLSATLYTNVVLVCVKCGSYPDVLSVYPSCFTVTTNPLGMVDSKCVPELGPFPRAQIEAIYRRRNPHRQLATCFSFQAVALVVIVIALFILTYMHCC